jgi:hypothetical protein
MCVTSLKSVAVTVSIGAEKASESKIAGISNFYEKNNNI